MAFSWRTQEEMEQSLGPEKKGSLLKWKGDEDE